MDDVSSEEEEEEDSTGVNQGLRVVKRLPFTRENAETLLVETSDGELVDIDKTVATKMSLAIRKKIESANGVIHFDNITSRALSKVMEYCHMHTAPHIVTMEKGMDLKTWDERFVKLDPGTLCELASAAYHLQIKPLVDLTCQAIAQLLKGKTPAEIRRTFNILYDFQPEDDAPPPTMRDKLRNKLCNPKRKEQKTRALPPPPEPVDTRSVDDLVSFINDGKHGAGANGAPKSKSKNSKKARQRERKKKAKAQESLRTSQEKVSTGNGNGSLRTSQELGVPRAGLKTSQEKAKTRGNQQEDRTTREKRDRREDIIQRIINMQRGGEEGEADMMRSNSTSPSPSFSSTSSSPVSSSPSSTSSSPLSSPLSSPSHSRTPSHNSSDFFPSGDDAGAALNGRAGRRDNTAGAKSRELRRSAPSAAPPVDAPFTLPPNQPNQRRQAPTLRQSDEPATLPDPLGDLNRDPLEISLDDDIWQEEEDDDMDPELKAQQDREVEEFRRRLEQINNTTIQRPRIPLPSTLSLALSRTVDSLKG
jgi:hypothetical protein